MHDPALAHELPQQRQPGAGVGAGRAPVRPVPRFHIGGQRRADDHRDPVADIHAAAARHRTRVAQIVDQPPVQLVPAVGQPGDRGDRRAPPVVVLHRHEDRGLPGVRPPPPNAASTSGSISTDPGSDDVRTGHTFRNCVRNDSTGSDSSGSNASPACTRARRDSSRRCRPVDQCGDACRHAAGIVDVRVPRRRPFDQQRRLRLVELAQRRRAGASGTATSPAMRRRRQHDLRRPALRHRRLQPILHDPGRHAPRLIHQPVRHRVAVHPARCPHQPPRPRHRLGDLHRPVPLEHLIPVRLRPRPSPAAGPPCTPPDPSRCACTVCSSPNRPA